MVDIVFINDPNYSKVLDNSYYYEKEKDKIPKVYYKQGNEIIKILEKINDENIYLDYLKDKELIDEYVTLSYEEILGILKLRYEISVGCIPKDKVLSTFESLLPSLTRKFPDKDIREYPYDSKDRIIAMIDKGIFYPFDHYYDVQRDKNTISHFLNSRESPPKYFDEEEEELWQYSFYHKYTSVMDMLNSYLYQNKKTNATEDQKQKKIDKTKKKNETIDNIIENEFDIKLVEEFKQPGILDRTGENIVKKLQKFEGTQEYHERIRSGTLLKEYENLSYEDISNIMKLRFENIRDPNYKECFKNIYKSLSQNYSANEIIKIIKHGIFEKDPFYLSKEIDVAEKNIGRKSELVSSERVTMENLLFEMYDNYKNIINMINEYSRSQSNLEKLKEKFPEVEEKQLEYIVENDLNKELKGGYSSKIVLASDNFVAKQADKEKNEHEAKIYKWKLPEFDNYRPKFKEIIDLSNSSLLVTTNVANEKSAYFKSGFMPFNKDGTFNKDIYIKHNLYLMGIFHKETKALPKEEKKGLSKLIYQTLDNIPHFEAISIPLENLDNKTFKDFKKSIPSNLKQDLKPIIGYACNFIKESNEGVIIDGDWKPGNIKNGYKLDFQIVRYGKEIEDIMNFLSDPLISASYQQTEKYVKEYIGMRSEHDSAFRYDFDKHKEMIDWKDSVQAKEMSIYASCTRKRPLEQKKFMDRRYKILQNLQQLVVDGKFM
jgi:hypothetical protein